MKVRIYFKTPDAVEYAADNAVRAKFHNPDTGDLKDNVDQEDAKELHADIMNKAARYIRYGEDVTLELDLETGKMVVLEANA